VGRFSVTDAYDNKIRMAATQVPDPNFKSARKNECSHLDGLLLQYRRVIRTQPSLAFYSSVSR